MSGEPASLLANYGNQCDRLLLARAGRISLAHRRWGCGHFPGPSHPGPYLNLPYRCWKMESHQGPSFFSPSVHGLGPTIEDGSHPLASQRFYRCGFAMVCWPSAHRGQQGPVSTTVFSCYYEHRCLMMVTCTCVWQLWGGASPFPLSPSSSWASYLFAQKKSFS